MLSNLTFVLGGASSGKSSFAEKLANESGLAKVYIATAQVFDDEMQAKVNVHKSDRDESWANIEEPFDVTKALAHLTAEHVVLIDCATMLLTNHMLAEHDTDAVLSQLLASCAATPAKVVIVSNEVGLSGVPENALARRFQRLQGDWNKEIAAQADTVYGVMAGLPVCLKGENT